MASTTVTFIRASTSQLVNPLTVNFTVAGTATFGTDYTVSGATTFTTTTGSVVIPANQTQAVITLTSVADAVVEPDETVILTLVPTVNVSSGTGSITWTILNDDVAAGTTVMLLHFDGANNSTTIVDSSASPLTLSYIRTGCKLSTRRPKFGTTALLVDWVASGNSGYNCAFLHASKLNLAALNFTIEGWYYVPVAQQNMDLYIVYKSSSYWLGMSFSGSPQFFCHVGGSVIGISAAAQTAYRTVDWHHLAATRSGNTLYLFVDGVLVGSTAISGSIDSNTNEIAIGDVNGSTVVNRDVDEVRIVTNAALYTANFTPSATAFTS